MEPEGSLPRSQQLAFCPFPEPDSSSTRSKLFQIHSNIILSSIHNCSKWCIFCRFPHHETVHISSSLMRAACPTQPPWIDFPNKISWAVQIVTLLMTQFHSGSFSFLPLKPKNLPQRPILEKSQLMFLQLISQISSGIRIFMSACNPFHLFLLFALISLNRLL